MAFRLDHLTSKCFIWISIAFYCLSVNVAYPEVILSDLMIDHRLVVGFALVPATPKMLKIAGVARLPEKSALIADIYENSPADKAGLKIGDQIVALNGLPLKDKRLRKKPLPNASRTIRCTIIHGQERKEVELTPVSSSSVTDQRFLKQQQLYKESYKLNSEGYSASGRYTDLQTVLRVKKQLYTLYDNAYKEALKDGRPLVAEYYRNLSNRYR